MLKTKRQREIMKKHLATLTREALIALHHFHYGKNADMVLLEMIENAVDNK